MAGKGTTHHKVHNLTGWGLIIGLPFAACSALSAISGGSDGFTAWLSSPAGALGFLAFVTAAVWYVKLEFDEVVMDYFQGGTRRFGLTANRLVALAVWILIGFAVIKLAFLG